MIFGKNKRKSSAVVLTGICAAQTALSAAQQNAQGINFKDFFNIYIP